LIAELATLLGFALLRKNVVLNSTAAITSRVTIMTIANYYLLPIFYKIPESVVVGLLASIAVFNVTQALIIIIPAYLIYLRIRQVKK